MKLRISFLAAFALAAALSLSAADGAWLKGVPAADRARTNPLAGDKQAIAAGEHLYADNCAHCHGDHAQGQGKRPALTSERISHTTDGELAWLLKNGNVFHGMPRWSSLPEPERWQIIAYLRHLNQSNTGDSK